MQARMIILGVILIGTTSGCSHGESDQPAKNTDAAAGTSQIFQTQTKALKQAKEVNRLVQHQAAKQRQIIDNQAR
jgi:hypothetical protein